MDCKAARATPWQRVYTANPCSLPLEQRRLRGDRTLAPAERCTHEARCCACAAHRARLLTEAGSAGQVISNHRRRLGDEDRSPLHAWHLSGVVAAVSTPCCRSTSSSSRDRHDDEEELVRHTIKACSTVPLPVIHAGWAMLLIRGSRRAASQRVVPSSTVELLEPKGTAEAWPSYSLPTSRVTTRRRRGGR